MWEQQWKHSRLQAFNKWEEILDMSSVLDENLRFLLNLDCSEMEKCNAIY